MGVGWGLTGVIKAVMVSWQQPAEGSSLKPRVYGFQASVLHYTPRYGIYS